MATEGKCAKNRLTLGQRAADALTKYAGSWGFICLFAIYLVVWMAINVHLLSRPFDPYPFILLNLTLSCLAAIQAPVILMSQNRAAERDRTQARRDYYINRKAEREIKILQRDMLHVKGILSKQVPENEIRALEKEIAALQQELSKISRD